MHLACLGGDCPAHLTINDIMQVHGIDTTVHIPRADRDVRHKPCVSCWWWSCDVDGGCAGVVSMDCSKLAVVVRVQRQCSAGLQACSCPQGCPFPCRHRCAQMGFVGDCCPRTADGTLMPCCAKAKAHPECSSDQYTSPEDAICPARTGKFLSVSHKGAGCCDSCNLVPA